MAEKDLEIAVGEMMRAQSLTVGLAESSTGGLIGHRITEIRGSSDYFVGSIVPYALDIQERLVGVNHATLEEHGVVSEPAAREMARGARRQLRTDVGLSVTGIAGPHSGRSTKPIGLTYIGLSAEDVEACERHTFGGDRSANKWQSSEAALDLLRRYLDRHGKLPPLQEIVAGVDPEKAPQLAMVQSTKAGILDTDTPQRLGVLSSAFNPLTKAHVKLAELAMQEHQLGEVMLELSKVNVDKRVYGASLAERLWMLKHFAQQQPAFSVGMCSHARFIDKATAIRQVYPEGTEVHFIVGYDTLVRVFDPQYYEDLDAELDELFEHAQFIVANRGTHTPADVADFLKQPVCEPYVGKIRLVELDAFHASLSSTLVRERLDDGEAVTDLVPAEIVPLLPLTALAGQAG